MMCRFRGEFKGSERARLEEAAHRFEQAYSKDGRSDPTWAFMHFTSPHHGAPYWGVRADTGFMVKAQTAKGLAVAVDIAREEELKRRSRALRRASRSASERIGQLPFSVEP